MSLAYRSFGTGRPVVLLHGLFGSGDNLGVIARGLEADYSVFLADLPNHGESPHLDSATQEAMAEAVESFVREMGIRQPVLAGHSIGGKVAMLMALRGAVDASAVVSIDMAPRRYSPSHTEIIAAMRGLPLERISSRGEADGLLGESVGNRAVRSFLLKNLVRAGKRYTWRLNLDAIAADYDRLLGWDPPETVFDGPALFVGGERSTYLKAERDRDLIARWFPRAELELIPDAGHWLHADKPDVLLRTVRRFLGELEPA